MVKPVVLDHATPDVVPLAGRAGDGGGTCIGLHATCVGEPLAVIADLGRHPGAELDPETGKAQDDFSVRVLEKLATAADPRFTG
jgi:hypothetical protein